MSFEEVNDYEFTTRAYTGASSMLASNITTSSSKNLTPDQQIYRINMITFLNKCKIKKIVTDEDIKNIVKKATETNSYGSKNFHNLDMDMLVTCCKVIIDNKLDNIELSSDFTDRKLRDVINSKKTVDTINDFFKNNTKMSNDNYTAYIKTELLRYINYFLTVKK